METKEIYRIGKRVRKWAERTALKEGFPDDLTGLCARASVKLFDMLRQEGYKPVIAYSSYPHFFVIVEGVIVDITATQFRTEENRKVLIVPCEGTKLPKHYLTEYIFFSEKRVTAFQKKTRWSSNQITQESVQCPTFESRGIV